MVGAPRGLNQTDLVLDASDAMLAPFPVEDPMSLVSVTEAAAGQIKRLLDQDQKTQSHALRLKVVGGGCSGLQYQLMFDDQRKDSDHEIEASGVRVVIDEKSALYLVGTVLDYVDSLMESGFKIQNPNAKTSCGCGQSFSA